MILSYLIWFYFIPSFVSVFVFVFNQLRMLYFRKTRNALDKLKGFPHTHPNQWEIWKVRQENVIDGKKGRGRTWRRKSRWNKKEGISEHIYAPQRTRLWAISMQRQEWTKVKQWNNTIFLLYSVLNLARVWV